MANTGILVTGIVLLIFGLLLTASIIGAILGIPLLIIGLVLIVVGAASSQPKPPMVYYPPPPTYYQVPDYYRPVPPPQGTSGSAQPVTVNVHQAPAVPAPPQIMRRCQHCNTVYAETQPRCPSCGASF